MLIVIIFYAIAKCTRIATCEYITRCSNPRLSQYQPEDLDTAAAKKLGSTSRTSPRNGWGTLLYASWNKMWNEWGSYEILVNHTHTKGSVCVWSCDRLSYCRLKFAETILAISFSTTSPLQLHADFSYSYHIIHKLTYHPPCTTQPTSYKSSSSHSLSS